MGKGGKVAPSKLQEWFSLPKNKATTRPATYPEMLRYADHWDYLLLAVGIFCNFVTGALSPLNMIPFNGIVTVLITGQRQYDDHDFNKDEFSSGIKHYAWMYFGIAVLTFITNWIALTSLFTVCERQVHRIRKKFLQSILNQDMAWFDHNEIGTLTHKMSSNIEKIKDGASDKIGIILQAVGALIAGITVALCQDWKMTLVMLGIVPFMLASLFGASRGLAASVHKEMSAYSVAGGIAEEVISGIRTVIAFNAQPFEKERYSTQLNQGRVIGVRKAAVTGFFSALMQLTIFFFMGGVFYYGTTLVVYSGLVAGSVFSVFWAVFSGAMRFGVALPQINVLLSARVAAGEIFSIIDREPELDSSSPSGQRPSDVKGRMEFRNVHFRYPTRPDIPVLKGVSFTVEPGQTVALVGHSGCGKSTMIGLLMRYYTQESGDVTLDGRPLGDLNVEWLRSVIGIVSQEPVLFQSTIAENLRMGRPDIGQTEMEAACRMANAHDFILKLPQGYETLIGDGGIKLSGGQKQRLAIARALVREPKILLLDEATSALDTESERVVQAALDAAATGRTTITIAHRLSTVRNAHRIIVFDKGNIVESGTHEELLALEDGAYRQLVAAQKIEALKQKDEPLLDENDEVISRSKASSIRASERIRRSIASVRSRQSTGLYVEDAQDELELEGGTVPTTGDMVRYARPEWPLFIFGLIVSLIRGCCWPAFSLVYGRLFKTLSAYQSSADADRVLEDAKVNTILFAVIGIVGASTTFLSGFSLGKAGENVAHRLRLSVYDNLLRQDASYFDAPGHSVGVLTSRLSQEASNVQAAIDQRLAEMLQGITALFAGIAIGFTYGWSMTIFCLFVACVLVVLQTIISAYLKRRGVQDAAIAGDASRIVTESIENVRTVQALTRQEYVFERFQEASRVPHRRAIARGAFMSISYAVMSSYVSFNFWGSYLYGMWLVDSDWVAPFVVFQVIEALNMAAMMISSSASYFPEFIRARISAGLMFGMMHEQPKIDNLSTNGTTEPITGNIQLNNVFFAYPNTKHLRTLSNLSLSAKFGQTVALVGPSGSGKSTVIQLLERFYDVAGGALRVDGTDVREINVRHLRGSIALVSQEPTLFNLSVRDNIAYGLEDATDAEIEAAAKLANIDGFVRSLPSGYDTSCGGRGTQLSGGQRQRIAIARAIIREPRILLLDEATAALDGESERLVQEALDRARSGRTCIVVAHRLSTIQNADLICVIENGRCVETGTHQQLLERAGLYHRLVKSQSMA